MISIGEVFNAEPHCIGMAQANTNELLSLELRKANTISVNGDDSRKPEKQCPGCNYYSQIFYHIPDWDDDIPNCGGCTAEWIILHTELEFRDNTALDSEFVTAEKNKTESDVKCSHCRYPTGLIYSLTGWEDGACGKCFSEYIATEDVDLRRQQ